MKVDAEYWCVISANRAAPWIHHDSVARTRRGAIKWAVNEFGPWAMSDEEVARRSSIVDDARKHIDRIVWSRAKRKYGLRCVRVKLTAEV